ncbi:MAG: hypothetical protein IPP44_08040 [Ideonella sp.]|nr:hypothetical protein [Ideonella sp.]
MLDVLFAKEIPLSPFTAYGPTTTNSAFARALVDNLAQGANIDAAKLNAWANELTPVVGQYATRGTFVVTILAVVEANRGGHRPVGPEDTAGTRARCGVCAVARVRLRRLGLPSLDPLAPDLPARRQPVGRR